MLDVLDGLNGLTVQFLPQLATQLTVKPTELARKAFTSGSSAVHEAVISI